MAFCFPHINFCTARNVSLKTLVTNNQADLAALVLVAAAHHGSHRVVHHGNRTDVIVLQGVTERGAASR